LIRRQRAKKTQSQRLVKFVPRWDIEYSATKGDSRPTKKWYNIAAHSRNGKHKEQTQKIEFTRKRDGAKQGRKCEKPISWKRRKQNAASNGQECKGGGSIKRLGSDGDKKLIMHSEQDL